MSCRCYRCEVALSRGVGRDAGDYAVHSLGSDFDVSCSTEDLEPDFPQARHGEPSPAGLSVPDCERHAELGWKLQLQWRKGILCSVSGYCRSKAFALVGTNTWQDERNHANVGVVGEIPS